MITRRGEQRPSQREVPSQLGAILGRMAQGEVIEQYRPLSKSVEWELGQLYWHKKGNKAFLGDSDSVPFVINNEGNLSVRAANVFFTNLVTAEESIELESELLVLELGVGVGLFARYFLDAFRDLCLLYHKDYYDRLYYVLGDRSEKMLLDVGRNGILAGHPGRYLLRVVDAREPNQSLQEDPLCARHLGKIRAVFLNYVVDCLPATVLKLGHNVVEQLCLRTRVARGVDLSGEPRLDINVLTQQAASPDPRVRQQLLDVFDQLSSDYEFQPADLEKIPHSDVAVELARASSKDVVLHNYGALQCLDRLLDLVSDQGFILLNDYSLDHGESSDFYQHQRFARSTSIGINFPLLKSYFTQGSRVDWVEPEEKNPAVYARLLGRQVAPETIARFQEWFSHTAIGRLDAPVQAARNCLREGRVDAALTAYSEALEVEPFNWVLRGEVSQFLTHTLREPEAGLEMAGAALMLNPNCFAPSWNFRGDAFVALGRVSEARQAFRRALTIDAKNVHSRFQLAQLDLLQKKYVHGVKMIAEGLVFDQQGAYRDGFLRMQADILQRVAHEHEQERLRAANRIRSTAPRPAAKVPSSYGAMEPGPLVKDVPLSLKKNRMGVVESEFGHPLAFRNAMAMPERKSPTEGKEGRPGLMPPFIQS